MNAPSASRSSSSMQMNHLKQEFSDSTFAPQRDAFSSATRSFAEQRITLPPQTPMHPTLKSTTNAFRARETPLPMSDASTIKSSIDQSQSQQPSAFHRPLATAGQAYLSQNQTNPSPVALITPPVNTYSNIPKPMQNGPISSGLALSRPPVPLGTRTSDTWSYRSVANPLLI